MDQLRENTESTLTVPQQRTPVGWYEETVPVRGCRLDLKKIRELYDELSSINRKFGEEIISNLPSNPEMSCAEWEEYKAFLLQDAFCLTVSITGERDQQLYGESAEIFRSDALPNPIEKIYFNNITAWQRHASNTDPRNRMEVFLDFSKPPLLDRLQCFLSQHQTVAMSGSEPMT